VSAQGPAHIHKAPAQTKTLLIYSEGGPQDRLFVSDHTRTHPMSASRLQATALGDDSINRKNSPFSASVCLSRTAVWRRFSWAIIV